MGPGLRSRCGSSTPPRITGHGSAGGRLPHRSRPLFGAHLAISHPCGLGSGEIALLLFGGPVLYVITSVRWCHVSTGPAWGARLLDCLALAVAGLAAVCLSSLVPVPIPALILVTFVPALKRGHRRGVTRMAAGT